MLATEALFREDSYLRTAEATVRAVNERGGILTDRTVFYATSGGQPGDTGRFVRANGDVIMIAGSITGESKDDIIHLPAPDQPEVTVGEPVRLEIDWERRFKLMRMHTACHLLTVVCPYPITGASVAEEESRVDFDIPDAGVTKEEVTSKLQALIAADHRVATRWIGEQELVANPSLVKSKNVRPPVGSGRIRLVLIGEDGAVDSQPCGGTHVGSTAEIGDIHIGKIEKKGRENRRFRLRFGSNPA